MNKHFSFLMIFLCFTIHFNAQIKDSIAVQTDSIAIDTVAIILPENSIQNPRALSLFWKKLEEIKQSQNKKINIIHIGDSHIQADLMTAKVRRNLQNVFGNAGRGFVFPHNLARTNGSWDVKFSSNANWNNYKIVSPTSDNKVGLSAIALSIKSDNFSIEFNAKDAYNFFKTIKIITPKNTNSFGFSTEKKILAVEKKVRQKISHKIKNGEAISIIADKYNISVADLKKANGLKSNNIRAGKKLIIPTDQMKILVAEKSQFIPLSISNNDNYHYYQSEQLLDKIYIIPNGVQNQYDLNGLIVENGNAGILYHNIGVNGAKLSDYNKYSLFFEQLKSLEPDLIVVSLGTNESFDKMKAEDFLVQMDLFIQNVKDKNPNVEFLVVTPPPSLFQRKFPNTYVADYAQKILNLATDKNFAVWDLYGQLGGFYGVRNNFLKGIIGNDRVHYTKKGYELQGDLFTKAILKTYEIMKNN